MPRFAILTHDHPFLHWDLLLESGDVLRAWRLLREPAPEQQMLAQGLPDHRMLYLHYEGLVSGGRGLVEQWDSGEYAMLDETPDRIEVRIQGRRLQADLILQRAEATAGDWTAYFFAERSERRVNRRGD